jgi:hypothetical protein
MNRTHFVLNAQKLQFLPALLLFLSLFAWTPADAQITPLGDSYINTATPTTNYGSKTLLDVDGASQTTYIQFNLASIPATASVSQATLKLYVNTVTTAGSFNVDYVNGSWSEGTIDASNAPAPGATIASNVSVTTADKNQYILVNVTSAVQAWFNGSETNNGLALVANSSFNATFDSKENTTTSHPPELDIAYAGGDGTITGITTASGSGLTGGGTSGTLNLSLTDACSASQVLQWNGSAWACSNAGTGTISGVTAGTALTGGGTSGNVTLNLNTNQVPLLAASNVFTGNQTVNGNLAVTGTVSGSSFEIGSTLFAFGSYSSANAFLGFAGNTTTTGSYNTGSGYAALQSLTTGIENTAIGYAALQGNTASGNNTAVGYGVLQSNSGNFNTAIGVQAMYFNTTGYQNTASGVAALYSNTTGFYNTANGLDALRLNTTGSSNTANGYGALGSNTIGSNSTAVGAFALTNSNVTNANAVNDAFGYQALYSNKAATGNAAFGYQALYTNTQNANTAIGYQALYSNNTGHSNTASGYQALYSNTSGALNTASGYQVLSSNTSGAYNTASGYDALSSNTTGEYNAALGVFALGSNTIGNNNTAIGDVSGFTNDGTSVTGSNDTFVGAGSGMSTGSLTAATAVGTCAVVSDSFALVLGAAAGSSNNQCGTFGANTNVGIDVPNPSNILTVLKGGGHAIADGWDTYSSRRWKTNIHTLHDALGKIEQLRGVSYDRKDSGKHEIGVIAEEVGAVVPEVVSWEKNSKDAQGVDYARLTALLIEAVKQQQRVVKEQQREISALRGELQRRAAKEAALESRLEQLERQRGETQLASANPVR